jgi:hypothetical protein
MNLNINPKTLHILLELVQGLGLISTVASLPGLSLVAPWAGIVGGCASGVATIIKTQFITGNIPATPPTPPTPPAA